MRIRGVNRFSLLAFLLLAFVSGCGREQAQSTLPPTVVSVTPLDGAVDVLLNTTVTATFSSVMAPATINTATFTVTGPGATAVAGAVSYSGSTATFTPTVSLPAFTLFVATITTGATDPTGSALAADYTWSFTTGAPTVISTAPADAAAAVAINTTVTATFSTVMDAATIDTTTFTLTGPGPTSIAGAVTYSGSTATFTPTAILTADTVYTATITTGAQDTGANALAADYVWTFTTDVPPTVVSTVPADAATAVAINAAVTATFSRAMNAATIDATTFTLTAPGPTSIAGAVTYSGSTATFTPTAILAADTIYTATITTGAEDPTGSTLAADYVWTFTTDVPPTVVSTVPVDTASGVAVNAAVTATFSRAMDANTVTTATLTLTGPGVTPVAGGVLLVGTTATFTPGAALAFNTLYTATVTTGATDLTGSALATDFVWTFTTEAQPNVTSTNPASAATNVPVNQKITATFNQPMDPATITAAGTFAVVVTSGGAAVSGAVTYDAASNTAIFTPAAALTDSTQFTATVTTAAQGTNGQALASDYVWSFTTGTLVSATAPLVDSTNPADVATLVPLNQKITATFSKAMDPATISAAGTFTVEETVGGAAVPGAVTYDPASRTVVFTPTADLTAATDYTATITTAAQDLAGNALIAGTVANPWTFTTGAVSNSTAPTITLTNPADGDVNVPIDKTISATFSAPMDPTTINNGSFTVAVAADGTPVEGTVTYDAANQIATFTPSINLDISTEYTATIADTVTDQTGIALGAGAAPNPWNFTTGTVAGGASPATIDLGSAASFAVMATSSISSPGAVQINGDVGLAPGTSQGIPPAQVNGTIHINDPAITQAQADLLAAYNDAVSRSANLVTVSGDLGGNTYTPGLYWSSSSLLITGNVTLDAQGDPNAVFIIQMGTTLTTAPGSQVILAGGAKASNIFWQVGSSATIDTTSIFKGNVLASVSITLNTGSVVEGRMFAGSDGTPSGTVTAGGTSITVPAP